MDSRTQTAVLTTGGLCIISGLLFDLGWQYTATAFAIASIACIFVTLALWEQNA